MGAGMPSKKPKRRFDNNKKERKHELDARRDSMKAVKFEIVDKEVLRSARKMFKALPVDTRTLTGVICGDPLPGRSALDRRQQA